MKNKKRHKKTILVPLSSCKAKYVHQEYLFRDVDFADRPDTRAIRYVFSIFLYQP